MVSNTDVTGFDYTGTPTNITCNNSFYDSFTITINRLSEDLKRLSKAIKRIREIERMKVYWTNPVKIGIPNDKKPYVMPYIRNKLYNKRLIRQSNLIET